MVDFIGSIFLIIRVGSFELEMAPKNVNFAFFAELAKFCRNKSEFMLCRLFA